MAYKDGRSGAMKIAEGAARRGPSECVRHQVCIGMNTNVWLRIFYQ